MNKVQRITLEATTDSSGAGTAETTYPLSGYLEEIRYQGSFGSTADFTFTRSEGGGTVLVVTNGAAPWSYLPRAQIADTSGTVVSAAYDTIPIDDYLTMVVAQGGSVVSGTVSIYYSSM